MTGLTSPVSTFRLPNEETVARMSEGMCPACAAPMSPADQFGPYTVSSGSCPEHGWFILRHMMSKDEDGNIVKGRLVLLWPDEGGSSIASIEPIG